MPPRALSPVGVALVDKPAGPSSFALVAALPGHAIAGGLILASAADERIAAEGNGEFGLSEVALGVPIPRAAYEIFQHLLGDLAQHHVAVL